MLDVLDDVDVVDVGALMVLKSVGHCVDDADSCDKGSSLDRTEYRSSSSSLLLTLLLLLAVVVASTDWKLC